MASYVGFADRGTWRVYSGRLQEEKPTELPVANCPHPPVNQGSTHNGLEPNITTAITTTTTATTTTTFTTTTTTTTTQ